MFVGENDASEVSVMGGSESVMTADGQLFLANVGIKKLTSTSSQVVSIVAEPEDLRRT
jgi:hypothetical protein